MSTISSANIPSGNGTEDTSSNENLLTKLMMSYVPSFITRCFGYGPDRNHPNLEADEGDIEVAQGTGIISQPGFVGSSPNTHGNTFSGIQLLEIITENGPAVMDQDSNGTTGTGIVKPNSFINASAKERTLLNLQKTGNKVVKYLVIPTSMVVAPNVVSTVINLFQVYATMQSDGGVLGTKQRLDASACTVLLKPLFGSALVNISLGVILFMLSTSKGNFLGKVSILKVAIVLTTASTAAELALLFAVGWQFVSLA